MCTKGLFFVLFWGLWDLGDWRREEDCCCLLKYVFMNVLKPVFLHLPISAPFPKPAASFAEFFKKYFYYAFS